MLIFLSFQRNQSKGIIPIPLKEKELDPEKFCIPIPFPNSRFFWIIPSRHLQQPTDTHQKEIRDLLDTFYGVWLDGRWGGVK